MLPPPPNADEPIGLKNISFAAVPDWVRVDDIDTGYQSPVPSQETLLIHSQQHHVTRREVHYRIARRMESLTAIHHSSQWRWDFDPATQHVTIHSLAVRRDGEIAEHASPSRMRVLHREENLERFVIDGYLSVVVLFEDVRVGDIIDVSLTVRTEHRVLPERFAFSTAVPTYAFTRLFYISVRFPNGHPIQWRTDSEKIKVSERDAGNGETEWSWQLERLAPRQPEPDMPSWFFHGRIIQASDFPSWEFIAEKFTAAWVEDFESTELQKVIAELSQAPTKMERVEKALRLVQDEIRYLSVNTELGGQIPAGPSASLKRRFGDCKDKSFLLSHILRRLGVPARPVLVNASLRAKVREFLPMPGAFNHAIVEYEMDNRRFWVDPTISMQGGGPLGRSVPKYEVGLPLGPGVKGLEKIVTAAEHGTYSLREVFKTLRSGTDAQVHVYLSLTGNHADQYRSQLAFETAPAVAQSRLNIYKRIYRDALRINPLEWQDDRDANKLEIYEAFHIPTAFSNDENNAECVIPLVAHAIEAAVSFTETKQRQYPLALLHPLTVEHRLEYEFETISDQWSAALQSSTEALHFEAKMNRSGLKTTYLLKYQTYSDHVPAARYLTHLAKVKDILASTQFPIYSNYPRTVSVPPPGRRFTNTATKPVSESPAEPLPLDPVPALESLMANCVLDKAVSPQSSKTQPAVNASPTSERVPHSRTHVSRARRSGNNTAAAISAGLVFAYILIRIILIVISSNSR